MPTFTRRRLQSMLYDMARHLEAPKLNDLKARLENKRVEQSLPAEIEFGILWSLSTMGDIEVEPEWYGAGRPDVYTEQLFEGRPCVVEITAISDGRLSQEGDTHRVATRLCDAANKIHMGHGKHLHFQFAEESGYTKSGYVRRRKVDKEFVPTEATIAQLRGWLVQEGDRRPLQVVQGTSLMADLLNRSYFALTVAECDHDLRYRQLMPGGSQLPDVN